MSLSLLGQKISQHFDLTNISLKPGLTDKLHDPIDVREYVHPLVAINVILRGSRKTDGMYTM